MQVLYLVILWSIKETNLDERKTEFQVNQSQQPTDKLSYRVHVTYAEIDLNFHYSQRRTHDQFVAGLRFLMLFIFQGIIGKGHASKPKAR